MRCAGSDLVRRMLQGDRTSFDDIIAWYSEDVLRLCYGLLWSREEAEDVLQEVMLRLVRLVKEGRFRVSNGSIKGFLLKAARNLCVDRLRKRIDFCSYTEDSALYDVGLYDIRTPALAADEERFQSAFEDALSHLTDAQRSILVLRELNGESYKDIADALHLSVDSVKINLYRARRKMRLLLAPFESVP